LTLPIVHQTGDTVALSVQTPKHLKEIGLLDPDMQEDEETAINFLFSMALEKVALFPFAYVVDRWRWGVFEGTIPPSEYNSHWWKLRQEYQGICSPISRSEKDFDPGAKYHVAANVEFIR
jgi:peptidyl-dipeptidase A